MQKSPPTRPAGPGPGARIIIGLGSNKPFEGHPPRRIIETVLKTSLNAFGRVIATSRLYSSKAWPDPMDPPFVNAAALMTSALPPRALLDRLHATETAFGRQRHDDPTGANTTHARYGPRTLDLDILDYGGQVLNFPDDHRINKDAITQEVQRPGHKLIFSHKLILPHPEMTRRVFVLRPLADICPNWRHPVTDETVTALLSALFLQGDAGTAEPLETPCPYAKPE